MNPSQRIDQLIAGITDWRGKTFAGVRKAILEADPEIIEEWKWMGSPVWSRDGIIAVANAHKGKVKLTFANGARLSDPDKIFNAGLDGNKWRAIDFLEGDKVNARALKNLIRAVCRLQSEQKEEESTRGISNESTQKQKDLKLSEQFSARRCRGACRFLRYSGPAIFFTRAAAKICGSIIRALTPMRSRVLSTGVQCVEQAQILQL